MTKPTVRYALYSPKLRVYLTQNRYYRGLLRWGIDPKPAHAYAVRTREEGQKLFSHVKAPSGWMLVEMVPTANHLSNRSEAHHVPYRHLRTWSVAGRRCAP